MKAIKMCAYEERALHRNSDTSCGHRKTAVTLSPHKSVFSFLSLTPHELAWNSLGVFQNKTATLTQSGYRPQRPQTLTNLAGQGSQKVTGVGLV